MVWRGFVMSACVHTPTSRSRYGSVADIASAAGPQSVRTIIRPLPRSLPVPIIVFQHLASHRARGASRFLESVATIHGQRSSAVIPTGSGSDESSGAIPVSAAEGTVFVQAAETCSSAHRPSLQLLVVPRISSCRPTELPSPSRYWLPYRELRSISSAFVRRPKWCRCLRALSGCALAAAVVL